MEDVFSAKDVSRLFGLSESRIRYWAQTGFIGPSVRRGNRRVYSFSDLIEIKVARDLLASGLPLQRVRKNLMALRSLLPEVERPLSRLRVLSDGDRMWVHAEDATFDAVSGQILLSLDTGELQDDVVRILDLGRPPRQRAAPPPAEKKKPAKERHPHRSAYRWFLEAMARDEDPASLEEAMDAYRRALELDPSLAAAHTNLGRANYQRGRTAEARHHFERALALDPSQPEARFNLANLYDEEGELELAIAELRRVAITAPDFADAHFNLGIALEKVGSRVQAASCFRRYLELTGDQETVWSRLARGHLTFLEGEDDAGAQEDDAGAQEEAHGSPSAGERGGARDKSGMVSSRGALGSGEAAGRGVAAGRGEARGPGGSEAHASRKRVGLLEDLPEDPPF